MGSSAVRIYDLLPFFNVRLRAIIGIGDNMNYCENCLKRLPVNANLDGLPGHSLPDGGVVLCPNKMAEIIKTLRGENKSLLNDALILQNRNTELQGLSVRGQYRERSRIIEP